MSDWQVVHSFEKTLLTGGCPSQSINCSSMRTVLSSLHPFMNLQERTWGTAVFTERTAPRRCLVLRCESETCQCWEFGVVE